MQSQNLPSGDPLGTNGGASTTAAAGLMAVITPVTGVPTVTSNSGGTGGQPNTANQLAPTNPVITLGMVHQPALSPDTVGQPNPNTTDEMAALANQMAQLNSRMDQMAGMFQDLMTRMLTATPGPAPNLSGWPPATTGSSVNSQPHPMGTPQQRLTIQTPSTPQHGYSSPNGPAASIAQLVQHPPPPILPRQQNSTSHIANTTPAVRIGQLGQQTSNVVLPPASTPPLQANGDFTPTPSVPHSSAVSIPLLQPQPVLPPVGTGYLESSGRSNRSVTNSDASLRSDQSSNRRDAARRSRENRDPSTDDESHNYAYNRRRPETNACKKITVDKFSSDDSEQDFSIWISQFEVAVNRCLNPHSQRRHHKACLVWLPSALKADAYSIWSRAEHKDTDWIKLKTELEAAFEDGNLRSEWKTNLKAYSWDEHTQSLQSYCAKVKQLVDSFETELIDCPAAKKAQYYLRFVNGLPEDYMEHVKLSLPSKCNDVEKAKDVCIQFQSCKRIRTENQSEVGASALLPHSSIPSRIDQNEADLSWLSDEIKQLKAVRRKHPPDW